MEELMIHPNASLDHIERLSTLAYARDIADSNRIFSVYNPNVHANRISGDLQIYPEKDLELISADNGINIAVRLAAPQAMIQDIVTSYTGGDQPDQIKQNILDQLTVDFPRMTVVIDHVVCSDLDSLFSKLEFAKRYFCLCTQNLFELLLMLCTQASFFTVFNILHTIYADTENSIFLAADIDHPSVHINTYADHLDVCLKKNFKQIDADSETDLSVVYTSMIIRIDCNILRGSASCYSVMIYWIAEKVN